MRKVPDDINHIVYFDNYYTNIPVISALRERGIYSLGTIRKDRIPNNTFPSEKVLRRVARGHTEEHVTQYEGCPISVVRWKDNNFVYLASSQVGAEPMGTIQRYEKNDHAYIDVPCPKIVQIYNAHMGGVDTMDAHIGRMKIRMKSKKWYFRLFHHLLDLAVINSWIQYNKRMTLSNGKTMTQKDFRVELAVTCMKLGRSITPTRGRPAQDNNLRKKKSAVPRPTLMVQKDGFEHWAILDEKRNRCKAQGCQSFTKFKCEKCNLYLCITNGRNCYKAFHKV